MHIKNVNSLAAIDDFLKKKQDGRHSGAITPISEYWISWDF